MRGEPPTPGSSVPRVLVAGGGIAGIAAALRLAGRGVAVELFETRKRLGGRATSFEDPRTGRRLDNCQHVLMGCCTNLLDLYGRLGVREQITWHEAIHFVGAGGRVDTITRDDLPAPLHTARAFAAARFLTWGEKFAIARAMHHVLRMGPAGREAEAETSFADWLAARGQPPGAIARFWEPVIVSACNETAGRVSARYALKVFADGFLAHDDAWRMGLPAVPLVELYGAAGRTLEAAGGRLRLGTGVRRILVEGGRARGLLTTTGERVSGDAVVSTLPPERLDRVLEPAAKTLDPRLAGLGAFTFSPILGIHLFFAEPVMPWPHLAFTRGQLQWLFRRGWDEAAGAEHLHGVISAAHGLVDRTAEAILELVLADAAPVLPRVREVPLVDWRVIKEKRATFSASPGVDRLRPEAGGGGIDRLLLAGDWCATGWPATMEGAARSGYLAADAALRVLGRGGEAEGLVGDLEPGPVARMAGKW